MSQLFIQIQDWFTNNVTIANVMSILNMFWSLGLGYYVLVLKFKERVIKIDVSSATDNMSKIELKLESTDKHVEDLIKCVKDLSEMIWTFASNTQIPDRVKLELSNYVHKANTLTVDIVETKENVVAEVKKIIENITPINAYEKLKNSIVKKE